MKKIVVLLAVLFLLLGTAMPSDAWVRGWHGGWHGGCCWGWWGPGAVIGGLALGAAVAATYPYPDYAAPAPVVYQQPSVYVAPPSASPGQREVVYPNGKYVLYGDGNSQPWQWVWVPAGPPAPPPPPSQ